MEASTSSQRPPKRGFWIDVPARSTPTRLNSEPISISSDSEAPLKPKKVEKHASKKKEEDDDDPKDLIGNLALQNVVGEIIWTNGIKYFYARLRTEEIRKVLQAPSFILEDRLMLP